MLTKQKLVILFGLVGMGCAPPAPADEAPVDDDDAQLLADEALGGGDGDSEGAVVDVAHRCTTDRTLHRGAGLLPLAITDDDYVFFQDGQALYVTGISRRAAPTKLTEVRAGNPAFIYTSGKVAFIWTDPDYTSPSFGVSPLMIWTARHGAKRVSEASAVGTLTTAADRDGVRVVFPSHAREAGTVSDLVEATTDGHEVRTLLTGVQTDYTNGPCRPVSAFLGRGASSYPAVVACPGADTTATLSIFRGDARRDVAGLANPPRLFADPERRRLLTSRASASRPTSGPPLLVTEGAVEQLEDITAGYGFLTDDGAAHYFVREPDGSFAVHRASRRLGAPAPITNAVTGLYGGGFGSNGAVQRVTSRRGRYLAVSTAADPQTGLQNLAIADLQASGPTVTVLDESLVNYSATPVEPFTSDSAHALYGKFDVANGTAQLYAAELATGARRAISDSNAATLAPAAGSLVAVGDNFVFNPANPSLSTADLKVVDAGASGLSRLVAEQANVTFFVSHDRRRIIYVTDQGAAPGLHVAPVR